MLQGVDINQVKQYNTSLKQYRDKAANINAQIEFTQKELNTICGELSAELGIEVNESNIEQIYAEQVEKINATLKSGNTVLAKIAEEEEKIATGQVTQPVQQVDPVQPVQQPIQPVQQPVQPVAPVAQSQPVAPVTPVAPQNIIQPTVGGQSLLSADAVAGSVFGNGQATSDMQALNNAGKLFKLGG